jgi:hypothetical protein
LTNWPIDLLTTDEPQSHRTFESPHLDEVKEELFEQLQREL